MSIVVLLFTGSLAASTVPSCIFAMRYAMITGLRVYVSLAIVIIVANLSQGLLRCGIELSIISVILSVMVSGLAKTTWAPIIPNGHKWKPSVITVALLFTFSSGSLSNSNITFAMKIAMMPGNVVRTTACGRVAMNLIMALIGKVSENALARETSSAVDYVEFPKRN